MGHVRRRKAAIKPTRTARDAEAASRLLGLLRAGADCRVSKVKRIRAKVRAGIYVNDLKLTVASERALRAIRHA